MNKLPLIAGLAALATPALALAGDSGDVPAATAVGKPVSCLRTTDIRETKVRNDAVIDFYTRDGKVYRNTLDVGGCPSLGFEKRFAYTTSIAQLCSVDTITVLQGPGIERGASCGLGEFQQVELAKAPR